MVFLKGQLTVIFIAMLAIAMLGGCGGSDDESDSADTPKPDPGPYVSIEKFISDEEVAHRPAEDGWFQVRVIADPAPKEQDLIVRTRLLFTELNISEKQVKDLKDDAFDEILWFRIPTFQETSEPIWIRSTITTALQVVTLSRRHKFEYDTTAADGSTIPEWWESSPYQIAHPSVLIQRYE